LVQHSFTIISRPEKCPHFLPFFLLNKDISLFWYELGHIHEKILFYEENTFFMSQLHNYPPKYFINCTIFYVCPKIFNTCTNFAKFESHFYSPDILKILIYWNAKHLFFGWICFKTKQESKVKVAFVFERNQVLIFINRYLM